LSLTIGDILTSTKTWAVVMSIAFGTMALGITFGSGGILDTEQKRTYNYNSIDHAKNCLELQTSYLRAIAFETGYFENGESVKVTAHEEVKASELGCK
jgi:hypothetical protein